ncbi:MAG TPA: helix-turn-helix domain-containing protein [Candidatus Dormibacteraeota bacterium]|nr:helix-turn-helix domain-containing protein [Candidatus Dormibacteraeota bacterium]
MARKYALGRRQASVDRTAASIVAAARLELELAPPGGLSVGAVARRAGVARATVYNRFGSRQGLITALAPSVAAPPSTAGDPRDAVHEFLSSRCARWATGPGLYRHLPDADDGGGARTLAESLAATDALRPGCSLREAQDVLGALGSFPTFDRLHQDGRRSAPAVAEILMRLAGGILA